MVCVISDAVPQPDNVILQNGTLRKIFSLERRKQKNYCVLSLNLYLLPRVIRMIMSGML